MGILRGVALDPRASGRPRTVQFVQHLLKVAAAGICISLTRAVTQEHREVRIKIKVDPSNFKMKIRTGHGDAIHVCS